MAEKFVDRIKRILEHLQWEKDRNVGWHEHKMSREDIQWLCTVAKHAESLGCLNEYGQPVECYGAEPKN